MKKTCIALIVLVALLSMLTACGKQADDPLVQIVRRRTQ